MESQLAHLIGKEQVRVVSGGGAIVLLTLPPFEEENEPVNRPVESPPVGTVFQTPH